MIHHQRTIDALKNSQVRLITLRAKGGVFRFHQPEHISNQPFFIHPIGAGDILRAHHQAAVFRSPLNTIVADFAMALHTARKCP